ncbi:MAG: helix-turn-helix transcriptional regulator [Chitinophagaceae bacterium]|nr:helix-turn-helix transcriptional regulator [Chitinophagaceae bacterium]
MNYFIENIELINENSVLVVLDERSLKLTFFFLGTDFGTTQRLNTNSYKLFFEFDRLNLIEKGISLNQFEDYNNRLDKNICCNTQLLLQEIVSTKYTAHYKELFIESKAHELLLCTLNYIEGLNTNCEHCKFLLQPLEKEKIILAREIILQNLQEPPTIPELSRQIGINQCYLKKGFKEIFKSTVYEFVLEQKMTKAKLLLSQNNKTISQIAEEVGYSNTSNFSNAFKRYTGMFPTELVK